MSALPTRLGTPPHSIATASGAFLDLADPERTWDGNLRDVARGLAMTCRFGGQLSSFFSVAEHSLLVCSLVAARGASDELRLAALLHDAHEAFYGDVPSPLKPLLGPAYRALCGLFDAAAAGRVGIPADMLRHRLVKEADAQALLIEGSRLAAPGVWESTPLPLGAFFWSASHLAPADVEGIYLDVLEELLPSDDLGPVGRR